MSVHMKRTMIVLAAAAGLLWAAEQGWAPHEGGLLKYRVQIRFGEEPDTMPAGWKFGRVSAVTVDAQGEVYVFQRGPKADPWWFLTPRASICAPGARAFSTRRMACAWTGTGNSG